MPSPSLQPPALCAVEIVDAQPHHMAAVQAIYSHYVLHDLCSFEEEVPAVAQMQSPGAPT
jgi:L-amino acid N-acyltransferase YncA